MNAALLSDEPRVTLTFSSSVWFERDMECGRVAEAEVRVEIDPPSPAEAATIERSIRRQLAAVAGSSITCNGLTREGGRLRVVGYRDGVRAPEGEAMRLFVERPALRMRDQQIMAAAETRPE